MTTNNVPAIIGATAPAAITTDQEIRDLGTRVAGYRVALGLGLVVHVTPKGVKSFRFRYRNAQGADTWQVLGKFGQLTLAQARAAMDVALGVLASGECVKAAKKETRRQDLTTLAGAFHAWFPLFASKVGADYAARTRRVLLDPAVAPLMARRLGAVDMPQVVKFCRALEVSRSQSYAREVAHALDKIYEHARLEGLHRGDNPARRVVEHLTPRDSQPWEALQLDAVPRYFQDVAKFANRRRSARYHNPRAVKHLTPFALRLLPYLTLRVSILRVARWDWISWDGPNGATLTVPAFTRGTKQRTTEKRADERGKNYAPYIVPLARQVVSMLRELQALSGHTPYLFPGNKKAGSAEWRPASETGWLERIRQLGWDGTTDERPAITVHGFRSLFATTAYSRYVITRVDEHALEFQQDHKLTDGVRAHYTRDARGSHRGLLLRERAQLMQWWADELETILARGLEALPQSRVEMASAFMSRPQSYISPSAIS
jgi:hypothetical protein